jgi:Fur family peroxide stress response transcriptional regulator
MNTSDVLAEHVRAHGGKVTSQRLLIWRALAGDTTHPTAEAIYLRVRPQLPSLSPATLYAVLNELVEWGELRRFDAGDGSIHFDPDTTPHAELICLRCHAIRDIPSSTPPRPLPTDLDGFRALTRSEQYYGYCADCRGAWGATDLGAPGASGASDTSDTSGTSDTSDTSGTVGA